MSRSTLYFIAGLAGIYVADVQLNQGRGVDSIGLYNWNKGTVSSYGNIDYGKDVIHNSINKIPTDFYVKDKAIDLYNEAYSKLVEAQKNVDDTFSKKFSWGEKDPKHEAHAHLDEARKHFAKAKDQLMQFGSNSIEEAQNKYVAAGNKIYDTFDTLKDNIKDQYEYTSDFVIDKYYNLYDAAGNLVITSQEKAQEVSDYYDDQLKNAKEQYDSTQSSWLHWRKAKTEKVQEEAKRKYDAALRKSNNAHVELEKWIKQKNDKAKGVLRDSSQYVYNKANEKADSAYSFASEVQDSAQKLNNDAKKMVNEQAENAKSYVKDANSGVIKAGSDSKENIKHNAEKAYEKLNDQVVHAYDYAGGVKDRAVQAGHDIKEDAEQKADTGYHYVAGAKDRVAQAGYDVVSYIKDKNHQLRQNVGRLAVNSQEKAEEAVAYYDEQLKLAKKEYDETQSSWLHWRKSKTKEVQDQAQKIYEDALKKDQEARLELDKWVANSKLRAEEAARNKVAAAQNTLDKANDKAQGWLDGIKHWFSRN
ncbi:hypothetical protein DAMA08_035180 [Martiniozyma asiatica (nom. inval.)]|nr:hypothetical protein DAMA08_035180 [Martiniozyma asiatica]